MANQRKKNKKKIGFWATDEEKDALMEKAKAAGFDNFADWLRSLIKLPLLAFAAFHACQSPTDWHVDALAASFSKAITFFASIP